MTGKPDLPAEVSPAVVAAIARCVLARRQGDVAAVFKRFVGAGHPKPCEWEEYPTDVLLAYLRDFNAWAFDTNGAVRTMDGDGDRRTDIKPLLDFQVLPRREQRRLRELAQYGEEPPGSAQSGTPA